MSGQLSAFGMQSGGTAVNVVIALDAGGKGEFAKAERVLGKKLQKLFAGRVAHKVRSYFIVFEPGLSFGVRRFD